jgi:hypothetical protein
MFLNFFSDVKGSFDQSIIAIPENVLERLFCIFVAVGVKLIGKLLYLLEVGFVHFQSVKHVILLFSGYLGDDVSEVFGFYNLAVHVFEGGNVCPVCIGS